MKKLGKVGLIGRFKPLHNGAYVMLEAACEQADKVIIGIGSSNKYNLRNPFTAKESEEMIHAALSKYTNYSIIHIPDFAHIPEYRDGQKWKEFILEKFGSLDYFISGNTYVGELLRDDYNIIHPATIIPREKQVKLKATKVRIEMALGNNWKPLVPESIAEYLENNKLVERFRKEFGLQTIALLSIQKINAPENELEERLHTLEG